MSLSNSSPVRLHEGASAKGNDDKQAGSPALPSPAIGLVAEASPPTGVDLQNQQPQLPIPPQRSTPSAEQLGALKDYEIRLRLENEECIITPFPILNSVVYCTVQRMYSA